MNWLGMIICVGLPAYFIGISTAVWVHRTGASECVQCGRVGKHDPICGVCVQNVS